MNRVTLSRLKVTDVPKMLSWGYHEDIRLDHYNFPFLKKEDYVLWYRSKAKFLRKKIYRVEDDLGLMVGFITIKKIRWFKREAEMGIVFNPKLLGQGYGAAGMVLMQKEFFEGMRMKRLWLRVASFNQRAIGSYEKVGFRKLFEREELYEDQALAGEIHRAYPDMVYKNNRLYAQYIYMEVTKEMYVNFK